MQTSIVSVEEEMNLDMEKFLFQILGPLIWVVSTYTDDSSIDSPHPPISKGYQIRQRHVAARTACESSEGGSLLKISRRVSFI